MILETERLILRTILLSDTKDIFEYSSEPNVGPNAGWKPHESLDETIEISKAIFINQENIFGIVLKSTNKMIGSVGLIEDPKRENPAAKMLGYAMSEKYWGNGYMTEAGKAVTKYGFLNLQLDLISAYCYPHNRRSKSVLKKLGFEYEGTLSLCEQLYNGTVLDNECYILKRV